MRARVLARSSLVVQTIMIYWSTIFNDETFQIWCIAWWKRAHRTMRSLPRETCSNHIAIRQSCTTCRPTKKKQLKIIARICSGQTVERKKTRPHATNGKSILRAFFKCIFIYCSAMRIFVTPRYIRSVGRCELVASVAESNHVREMGGVFKYELLHFIYT